MESPMVFKVKYGDTLRRFRVNVDENGDPDLNMAGLKAKILGLFGFTDDADMAMTYEDEDGDKVALVDDDDLRDVVKQDLDYLRIDVQLKNDKFGKSQARSSGSSTPMRSPLPQNPLPTIDTKLADILTVLPEPLLGALTQLFVDLPSKAACNSTVLTDLVDTFSKMGQSYLNPAQQYQSGVGSTSQTVGSKVPEAPLTPTSFLAPTAPNNSKGECKEQVIPNSDSTGKTNHELNTRNVNRVVSIQSAPITASAVIPNSDSTGKTNHEVNIRKFNRGVWIHSPPGGIRHTPISASADLKWSPPTLLNAYTPAGAVASSVSAAAAAANGKDSKKQSSDHPCAVAASSGAPTGPFYRSSPMVEHFNGKYWGNCPLLPCPHLSFPSKSDDGQDGKKQSSDNPCAVAASCGAPTDSFYSSSHMFNPFNGTTMGNDSAANSSMMHPRPLQRNLNSNDASGGTFHKGVQCDGCGVLPIIGPRYKSKVKEDYDLCSICFGEMGNDIDYMKIDKPAAYRHPRFFKLHDPHARYWTGHPFSAPDFGPRHARPKLDSRFIMDVNVPDGSLMAPSTPFTKIWKMRNNGGVAWPQGTKLVWIGGDKFSNLDSAHLEISAHGVAIDGELDIAVDFVAPELPGRYTSYWRMASPSGAKFGQRVWVLIQVEPFTKDAFNDGIQGLNLNLPPDCDASKAHETIDMDVQPSADAGILEPSSGTAASEHLKPKIDEHAWNNQEQNISAAETLLVGEAKHTAPQSPSVPNPIPEIPVPAIVKLSEQTAPHSSSLPYPVPYVVKLSDYPALQAPPPFPYLVPEVSIPAPVKFSDHVAPLSSSLAHPYIDISEAAAPGHHLSQDLTAVGGPPSNKEVSVDNAIEKTLLKELDIMGFKQVDLNKEILRRNEYDLEQSVDDLCGVAEWDPMLQELQEMGFGDQERNRELLKKNNGSIKRVVMDLIAGEKKA